MESIIRQFRQQRVLVIGELMLDVYLSGTSNRICREAPVPIVNLQTCENVPGGAANAAVNLAVLGAQTTFLTVTGKDREGRTVAKLLREKGVDTRILYDPQRQTLTKKRVLADDQLLVRYDYGSTHAIADDLEQELIAQLETLYVQIDAVLVSDYGYGILTDGVVDALARLMRRKRKMLVVDSKHLPRYRALAPSAVKPNYQETLGLLELNKAEKGARADQILRHGQRVLDMTGAIIAAITIDSEGAVIFEQDSPPYRTHADGVPDAKAAGAGDTYASVFTLGLTLALPTAQIADLAAAAATVVVHKNGTATCSAEELIAHFTPPQQIIRERHGLAQRVREYREHGKRIVFTNGCFDLLHRGHISYLTQAKQLGDVLIVGVNSDSSVRRLKGAQRPINALEDRLHVLAALDCVDHVISFEEDMPAALIDLIRPEIYVKGGDYTRDTLPEVPAVEAYGGKVEILPYVEDRSTSSMIDRIRHSLAGD